MIPIGLNYTSGVPIYVQVKEAIKNAIITGSYPQGAQLPTVRQVAVELRINANTVSRAYTELEREGVISSQQGRGTFVTLNKNIDYESLAKLEYMAETVFDQAMELGFNTDDVIAIFESIRRKRLAEAEKGYGNG